MSKSKLASEVVKGSDCMKGGDKQHVLHLLLG